MDIRVLVFDGLQPFELLSVPKVDCPIDCHCDDLVLLVVKENVQDFCVDVGLDASYDAQSVRVYQKHVAL